MTSGSTQSPDHRDRSQPTTMRSAPETTAPRACARRLPATAGTGKALPASVGGLAAAHLDRLATPGTSHGHRWRSPHGRPSKGNAAVLRRSPSSKGRRPDSGRSPLVPPKRDGAPSAHVRALGLAPPWSAMNFLSDEFCLPRCIAMRLTGTPASRMSQIVLCPVPRTVPIEHLLVDELIVRQSGRCCVDCCVDRLRTQAIGGTLKGSRGRPCYGRTETGSRGTRCCTYPDASPDRECPRPAAQPPAGPQRVADIHAVIAKLEGSDPSLSGKERL